MEDSPKTYQLSQEDIKEAISDWLNHHPTLSDDSDFYVEFDITFDTNVKMSAKAGSGDWFEHTIVTAVAVQQG
jgi:hypothetical protein